MDRLSQTAVLCHLNTDKPEVKPISKQFHLGGIPTVVIMDPKGQEVDRIIGYEGDRSEWLKALLASLYGIDTIGDLQSRYEAKSDLKIAHQLAQKFLDRGDGATSLAWVVKARSLKPDSETDSKLTLIQGEATLFTDPPKGAEMLLKLATAPGSPLALDAFQTLSAFYKRQARNATSPEEKQKAKAARLEVFHAVVTAQPANPDVLSDYAWYCAGEGIELDKALTAAQKAVELKPKDGDALSTLAEVQFKLGKKDDAVATIAKAIALSPGEESFKEQKEKFLKGDKEK
jgi:tetratricopeptide (TPR) repeat protein